MRNQRNKWILTDNDCCQYIYDIEKNKYKMIQYIRLYLEEPNKNNDISKFFVVENEIDLNDFSNDDICSHISSYGYNFINLINEYGNSSIRIIAECILENTIIDNENIVAEFKTKKEAIDFIEKYIEIDNYTEV